MKVLHINCNYSATALHQCMVEHLDRLGVDSAVFVPIHNSENTAITPNENVIISRCFRKWDRISFYYKQSKIQNALERSLPVSTFDLMHAYTLFTDGNCAYEMHKKYSVDYVVAVRNTDVNFFLRRMPHLRKRGVEILRNAKAVFFLSEAYKQIMLQKYVPSAYHKEICEKSYIIPNGVDAFWLRNLRVESGTIAHNSIKLVYAGRIDANKNIATTQAAMKILRAKGYDVRLTVVGKVKDKGVFKQILSDEFTTYIPPKDKSELINIYRDNDIFVMPSFTESFGLVYVEAISQGLPVIYSADQGFDGQFPEGEVGYRVDPHSPEDIAEAVMKIVADYEMKTKDISKKACEYDWKRICSKYLQLYQTILHIEQAD